MRGASNIRHLLTPVLPGRGESMAKPWRQPRPAHSVAGIAQRGMSLVELSVLVLAVGVFLAFALYAIGNHGKNVQRAEAQRVLLDTARALDRCYREHGSYLHENCPTVSDDLRAGAYRVEAAPIKPDHFTLRAIPEGRQATDACGILIIHHTGLREPHLPAACWEV